MKAAWGLDTTQDNAPYCWGARAIYKTDPVCVYIDLVWDRQEIAGEATKEERMALLKWLNTIGIKRMTDELTKKRVPTDSHAITTISDDKFILTASPRGSYGYLYLVAEPNMGPRP